MNAWLITWERLDARPTSYEKIVAILGSRRSERAIADIIEVLYLRATSDAGGMAQSANRPRNMVYRAEYPQIINNVPHGDRILCGHNPWLYGRKVTNLTITEDGDFEVVTWAEPPIWRRKGTTGFEIEIVSEGEHQEWRRPIHRPLSEDAYRWTDRES